MKMYNTLKPEEGGYKNFNFLPYYSIYFNEVTTYLNIGIFHICLQFKLR